MPKVPTPEDLLYAFIPLFVAIDAPGVLPAYLGLTEGLVEQERRVVATKAILVAGAIGFLFLIGGRAIFRFLGITVPDFKIAGGLILLIIALTDLLRDKKRRPLPPHDIAIVPLGMPLIVGPGALTALVVLNDTRGIIATSAAFVVNLAIAWGFLSTATRILRFLGPGGAKAISKIMSLLLCAIAVMMIRSGVFELIEAARRG